MAAILTGMVFLAGWSGLALANPDPHSFSLDALSPSAVNPADVLNPGGPPPPTQIPWLNLRLVVGDELDALSSGVDAVQRYNILYFSVDRASLGIPGLMTPLDVAGQAARNQQAGDVFVTINPAGAGNVPMGLNMVRDNQLLLGAIPLIGPMLVNAGPQDNMDALSFEEFDLDGNHVQDLPVYFSLAAGSPSLGGLGTAADVLISVVPGAYGVFAPGMSMGLLDDDDLDALALLDLGRIGLLDPGVDVALFSLARGSPTLALLGASPADVFLTRFGGASFVRYSAASLGLRFEDNVDGLEVQVPEPACLGILVAGGGLVLAARRHRR